MSQPTTSKHVSERPIKVSPKPEAIMHWVHALPLVSARDLCRCLDSKPLTMYRLLARLEHAGWVEHLRISEPGWPPHQRYLLTQQGRASLRLHEATLATDVMMSLMHVPTLIRVHDFLSRLIAQARTQGCAVIQASANLSVHERVRGRLIRLTLDGWITLVTPTGCYAHMALLMDTGEAPFHLEWQRRRSQLRSAQTLRQGGIPLPCLLLITARSQQWYEALAKLTDLPFGAMTSTTNSAESWTSRIWVPFSQFAPGAAALQDSMNTTCLVDLASLLNLPVRSRTRDTSEAAERHHMPVVRQEWKPQSTQSTSSPWSTRSRVSRSPDRLRQVREEASHLTTARLIMERMEGRAEATRRAAALTLALSGQEKLVLLWLGQHPLHSKTTLLPFVQPIILSARSLHRVLMHLLSLGLITPYGYSMERVKGAYEGYELYALSPFACYWLSQRFGVPPAEYLCPLDDQPKHGWSSASVPRGVAGLWFQRQHTIEMYACLQAVQEHAHRRGEPGITVWKNARQSVRWYCDERTSQAMQVRPDAEITYTWADGRAITFWLEYDRDTMSARDYRAKLRAYQDYHRLSGEGEQMPPLLFVVQHERSVTRLRKRVEEVSQYGHLPRIIVIEERTLHHQGLMPWFP